MLKKEKIEERLMAQYRPCKNLQSGMKRVRFIKTSLMEGKERFNRKKKWSEPKLLDENFNKEDSLYFCISIFN